MKGKNVAQNKYLGFMLGEDYYGISVLKVKEIMGLVDINEIPQTPNFLKGVINLRGKIIPIIDLRIKFGFEEADYNDRTCIIVVEAELDGNITLMGIVVDIVSEVIYIPPENIEEVNYLKTRIKADYIKGIAKLENNIMIILDIDRILEEEEFVLLNNIEEENNNI